MNEGQGVFWGARRLLEVKGVKTHLDHQMDMTWKLGDCRNVWASGSRSSGLACLLQVGAENMKKSMETITTTFLGIVWDVRISTIRILGMGRRGCF